VEDERRRKRFLRRLTALAGLTGAAMLINRRLRETSMLPQDHVGGTRLPWAWRGHDMFVTDMGEGPPIILAHGMHAGSSSYEFRALAPLLAHGGRRVIAFDFPGCGLSAMPDIAYGADLFVDHLLDLITEFTTEPVTLLGSSLGAAYAIQAAARAPHRIDKLIGICPTGLGGVLDEEPDMGRRSLGMLMHAPLLGESAFNGVASNAAIRKFLRTSLYANPHAVTEDIVDHYHAITHQPGARFVPAALLGGALHCNVARDLPFVAAPFLVLWGERASRMNPLSKASEYIRLAKEARLVTFARSGLLPHEEEPEEVAAAVLSF
jgi:pimeloyl-ACP methyl ester carboxylesterase